MKVILKAALAAAALTASAPAWSSTLMLIDFNAQEGERVTGSPYADQEIARMIRQGLLRPVLVPIDDQGSEQRTTVDILAPTTTPPLGIGQRILKVSVVWEITTQRQSDQMSYQAVIRSRQAYEDGVLPPTQVTQSEIRLDGIASMRPGPRPSFSQRYTTPGGPRMLIGFVRP